MAEMALAWRPATAAGALRSSALVLAAVSAAGVAAYGYPFVLSTAPARSENLAHSGDAPLVFGALIGLAGLLFLSELTSGGINAKAASALAVLALAAAALRVPPLPGGASAFYFLIILGGYVFGARFGFLLGAVGLFVSAFASGGFGPWVPFQMFASGWLGMTAGWLGGLRPLVAKRPRAEVLLLAAFGAMWGFLYGALLNLWFWPYIATGENISWQPGMGLATAVRHYWSFYVLTSAGWDVWSAIANATFIVAAGPAVLGVLTRFRRRFDVRLD